MKSVLVAVPNTGWLHHAIFLRVMQWVVDWISEGNGCQVVAPTRKCNENAYQHIAKQFWESRHDYLIQIDDDNPPTRSPFELIQYEKDIIGLPTPIWKYRPEGERKLPFQWNVYYLQKDKNVYMAYPPRQGLQRVDAIGAGSLVVHRRVFDAPLMRKEGWHRKWDKENGTETRGLDLAFSERARKCGFEVWTHWDYRCNHFKEIDLLDVAHGFEDWMAILLEQHGGVITSEAVFGKENAQHAS